MIFFVGGETYVMILLILRSTNTIFFPSAHKTRGYGVRTSAYSRKCVCVFTSDMSSCQRYFIKLKIYQLSLSQMVILVRCKCILFLVHVSVYRAYASASRKIRANII
jgi:hypothetical protein